MRGAEFLIKDSGYRNGQCNERVMVYVAPASRRHSCNLCSAEKLPATRRRYTTHTIRNLTLCHSALSILLEGKR